MAASARRLDDHTGPSRHSAKGLAHLVCDIWSCICYISSCLCQDPLMIVAIQEGIFGFFAHSVPAP